MATYSAHLLPLCLVCWLTRPSAILGLSMESRTHFVGEIAHLRCGETPENPVFWYYEPQVSDDGSYIIIPGEYLTDGDREGRLKLNDSIYTLIIENLNISDRGVYIGINAADGQEVKCQVRLDVDVERSVVRKSMTAVVGERVTLPCRTTLSTPVDWYYQPSEYENSEFVCSAGTLLNGYKTRFVLDRSAFGDFSLIIRNVTKADDGVYICIEDAGLGMKHRLTLHVTKHITTHVIWQPKVPTNEYLHRAIIMICFLSAGTTIATLSYRCCRRIWRRPTTITPEERKRKDTETLTRICEVDFKYLWDHEEAREEMAGSFPERMLAKHRLLSSLSMPTTVIGAQNDADNA